MLSNIPKPHKDQTLESYVALLQIENGIHKWGAIVEYLFGSHQINLRSIAHAGLLNFLSKEVKSSFHSLDQLIQNHSLLALYKPFLTSDVWDKVIERLKSNRTIGLINIFGGDSNNPFHAEDRYCPCCVENEVLKQGYAFSHRCHQVKGFQFCLEHKVLIISHNELSSHYAYYHGLLFPKCDTNSGSDEIIKVEAIDKAILNFSRWVSYCFTGQLNYSNSHQRVEIVQERLKELARIKNNADSLFLNKRLIESYGNYFLEDLNHTISIEASQWVFLYLQSYVYNTQPISNILILSELFSDLTDFTKYFKAIKNQGFDKQEITSNLIICWHYGIIRDLLSIKNISDISKKYSITSGTINRFLKACPSLDKRRKEAVFKGRRRKYRKSIENCLITNSLTVNSELFLIEKEASAWVKSNDNDWLNKTLLKYNVKSRSNSKSIDLYEDKTMSDFFSELLSIAHQKSQSLRITKELLAETYKAQLGFKLDKQKHPITYLKTKENTESKSEYINRLVNNMGYFAQTGSIEKCTILMNGLFNSGALAPKVIEKIMTELFINIPKNKIINPQSNEAEDDTAKFYFANTINTKDPSSIENLRNI